MAVAATAAVRRLKYACPYTVPLRYNVASLDKTLLVARSNSTFAISSL